MTSSVVQPIAEIVNLTPSQHNRTVGLLRHELTTMLLLSVRERTVEAQQKAQQVVDLLTRYEKVLSPWERHKALMAIACVLPEQSP